MVEGCNDDHGGDRWGSVSGRTLGTMITYGYPDIELADELTLAAQLGALVLEILPEWSRFPDPVLVRRQVADRGLSIHSAHGCWGGRTIRATRVNLARPSRRPTERRLTI